MDSFKMPYIKIIILFWAINVLYVCKNACIHDSYILILCVKKSAIKDEIGDISFILLHIDLKILISTQQMQWSFTEKPVNIIPAWTAVCSPVLKIS